MLTYFWNKLIKELVVKTVLSEKVDRALSKLITF